MTDTWGHPPPPPVLKSITSNMAKHISILEMEMAHLTHLKSTVWPTPLTPWRKQSCFTRNAYVNERGSERNDHWCMWHDIFWGTTVFIIIISVTYYVTPSHLQLDVDSV